MQSLKDGPSVTTSTARIANLYHQHHHPNPKYGTNSTGI